MQAMALAPTRNRGRQRAPSAHAIWAMDEDRRLSAFVENERSVSWCTLAKHFPGKTAQQLAGRWEKVLNPRLVKGSWTRDEDQAIIGFVGVHGDRDWARLAATLNGRTGKQCRERFKNHLDPSLLRDPWGPADDDRLIDLHGRLGNAWTRIAAEFPGRTDNCVKNRWNSTIRKRLDRIERGEPLLMKRGRKPKLPAAPHEPDGAAACSSPVHVEPAASRPNEVLTLTGSYGLVVPLLAPKRATILSVQENRDGLRRLLGDAA